MAINKEKVANQLAQERENDLAFKQGRVAAWHRIEDLYYCRGKKTVKGQFNVPFPVMSGYVNTLQSKIDERTIVKFKERGEDMLRSTLKVQAFWDTNTNSEDRDLSRVDLAVKKLAIFSGRGIARVFGESEKEFKFHMRPVDHYDFGIDPMTRGDIETAKHMNEGGVFLSREQLVEGANSGLYDSEAVDQLLNGLTENTIKENDDKWKNKASRANALGLDIASYNFQGEGMIEFIEAGTTINGERYYALWNQDSRKVIRLVPLKEMFGSGKWPWKSYATHEDEFNFWSMGPCDDIMPICEAIFILGNQELTNRNRRNMGQRAYDPEVFPDASKLEFRPDGLVPTLPGASKVAPIGNGVYTFQTPELTGTINLVEWMDNFIGQKSGVTAATQGNANEQKVGIYQGNVQQVADRLGLQNKAITSFWRAVARAFVWACKEHLHKEQAVRLIGERGVEWDTLTAKEIDPDVDILVESGSAELQANEVKKQRRANTLAGIAADPALAAVCNPKWRLEQTLLAGDFTDEEVRVGMDTDNTGNRKALAKAAEAIVEIVEGKKPALYRGANTAFQQKIVDYALDNTDDDLDLYMRLMTYSEAHDRIVEENMLRQAMFNRAKAPMAPPGPPSPNQLSPLQPNQPAMA